MKRPYKLLNGKKPCPLACCQQASSAFTVRLQKKLTKGQQAYALIQERRYKGIFNPFGYPDIYLQEAGSGKMVSSHVRSTQFRNEKLCSS